MLPTITQGLIMAVRKRVWTTRRGEQREAWIVDYTDGSGKRHIQTFAQKKKADAYAAKVRVDINAGTHVALDSDMTIAKVADKWIKRVEADGRERSTVRQYRDHAKLHIVPRIGTIKLAKLTRVHVERFRDDLLSGEKKLSQVMARKVWVSFKSMLKNVHCSHLADNVRVSTSKRNKRKLEPGRDIPTPDEVRRLIEAAANKPKQCMFLKVAALTGLRASELLGLGWSDVDLRTNELHVHQRVDTRHREIGVPKTEAGTRTIPFGPDLALALKQWKLACPKGELDLVFPSRDGAVLGYRNFAKRLEPIFKAAQVVDKQGKPKYAPHAFRHFFASWCINPRDRGGRELPPKVVQQWLGHSSITMTLDIYGHLFRDSSDRAEITASERALLG
jgi:integrase